MTNPINDIPSEHEQRRRELLNIELRKTSLELAVKLHCEGKPEYSVRITAKQYYKFLRGETK